MSYPNKKHRPNTFRRNTGRNNYGNGNFGNFPNNPRYRNTYQGFQSPSPFQSFQPGLPTITPNVVPAFNSPPALPGFHGIPPFGIPTNPFGIPTNPNNMATTNPAILMMANPLAQLQANQIQQAATAQLQGQLLTGTPSIMSNNGLNPTFGGGGLNLALLRNATNPSNPFYSGISGPTAGMMLGQPSGFSNNQFTDEAFEVEVNARIQKQAAEKKAEDDKKLLLEEKKKAAEKQKATDELLGKLSAAILAPQTQQSDQVHRTTPAYDGPSRGELDILQQFKEDSTVLATASGHMIKILADKVLTPTLISNALVVSSKSDHLKSIAAVFKPNGSINESAMRNIAGALECKMQTKTLVYKFVCDVYERYYELVQNIFKENEIYPNSQTNEILKFGTNLEMSGIMGVKDDLWREHLSELLDERNKKKPNKRYFRTTFQHRLVVYNENTLYMHAIPIHDAANFLKTYDFLNVL